MPGYKKLDPRCVTFVLQQYKNKWACSLDKQWNFCLRFIEHPYRKVLKMLNEKSWYFTLRPALESGLVASEQLKVLDEFRQLDDGCQAIMKLALDGIAIDLLMVEDDEGHLEKIIDMNTKKTLFEHQEDKERQRDANFA